MAFKIWRKYDEREIEIKTVDDYISSGISKDEAIAKHRNEIKKKIWSSVRSKWLDQSFAMFYIEYKSRNIKMLHYRLTKSDKIKLLENPSALLDIPRDYVPKIDKILSSEAFEYVLRDEFMERFDAGDIDVLDTINKSGTFTAFRNGTKQDEVEIGNIKEKYMTIVKNMIAKTS